MLSSWFFKSPDPPNPNDDNDIVAAAAADNDTDTSVTLSVPQMTLSDPEEHTIDNPAQFPALNGPQRLVAAATPQPKKRKKVALEPGHSALDWARLKSSGEDLRGGVTQLGKYTLSDLKLHKSEGDAWTALNGKVYNITPYLKFHPGGVKEIMRAAGRDGTRLFSNYFALERTNIFGFMQNPSEI
ncbi:cytochrome b5-like heme/steroid binding domain-containing protein [Endogone sp. FLAS-F59071]|nr:cytochrome b5-like heme/steroid binding domain-containing protein [Endogone sp. FLAS-F59071]|eukprot:RUS18807.1 cytochrome b5-like heme/steroid binding domain-containing protein [Endogone sp. FLAS-F59071]